MTLQKDITPNKIIGKKLFTLDITDSTNTQLRKMHEAHALANGSVLIAKQQTNGKGTDGNEWVSEKGNIYASILFEHSDKINTLFPLYPAVALAKVLRKNYNINAHVKWPNDVLVGTKKIAGILCEGVMGQYMIMGIGINVLQTQFYGEISNKATSIALECDETVSTESVLNKFLSEYENLYYGICDIRKEWLEHTEMIGKTIKSTQDGVESSVTVSGLTQEGFLEIITQDGHTETWIARRGLDISAEY